MAEVLHYASNLAGIVAVSFRLHRHQQDFQARNLQTGNSHLPPSMYICKTIFADKRYVQLQSIAYYTGDTVSAPAGYSYFLLTRKKRQYCFRILLQDLLFCQLHFAIFTVPIHLKNDNFRLFKSKLFYQSILNYLRGFSGISWLVLYLKHLLIVIICLQHQLPWWLLSSQVSQEVSMI